MKIRKQFFIIFSILIAVPVFYFSAFFFYIKAKPYFEFLQEENLPNPRQIVMTFSIISEAILTFLSLLMPTFSLV